MPTQLTPYLSFRDNARTAMEFYQSIFGGKLSVSTFKEFHVSQDPAEDNKLMHAQLDAPGGITLMGADTPNTMELKQGSSISIALSGEDLPGLSAWFEKLSAGGFVIEPLKTAPWGDSFGMCVDKFGVTWMVNVAGPKA